MSDYTKATNFTSKDTLPTGNANKIVKGTEIDTEFTAIAAAITSKANSLDSILTGTPVAPTATAGTNTTQIATTAFVNAERTNVATLTNKTLTSPTINGGTITGITALAASDGGTGLSSAGTSGNVLTSNGTGWISTGPPVGQRGQAFTSSGTFTIPSGVSALKITVVGGGGGGGSVTPESAGGGGGGGGGSGV